MCRALVDVAHTTACHTPHLVRRQRQDLRSTGVNGCAHAGDNPAGVRRRPAGAAGDIYPALGLGRTTEAACLAGLQGSVPNQDQAGRRGI